MLTLVQLNNRYHISFRLVRYLLSRYIRNLHGGIATFIQVITVQSFIHETEEMRQQLLTCDYSFEIIRVYVSKKRNK